MKKLQSFDKGIYCLDAEYIQDEIAAVYIIVEGNEVAIIETATSYSVPIITQALADLNLSLDNVKYIIPTHIHLDHAGGCGALLKQCPQATILVHPRGIRHMIDPSKLILGATAVYGEEKFKQLYGTIEPIDATRIRQQDHESSVTLGTRELIFYHTEGHAKHHFCIYDTASKSIFSGDTFGLSYPSLNSISSINKHFVVIPTTTPIHFDPNALKKSLHLIVSLKPSTVYLTHFGPIDHVQSAYLQLLFWVSFYDGLVHNAIKDNVCSEEYLYQSLLKTTQDILENSHGISADDVKHHLNYDLRLNAQGLYHYSQSL